MPHKTLERNRLYPGPRSYGEDVVYKWTGEFRPPRAGEYFLSGARIEAYLATNDLDMPYHIAREMPRPKCTGCGQKMPVEY